MLKNYLVVAWRNLLLNRIYSLVNITGLVVGIASSMLLVLHIQHELSYDSFHRNADRIFRLISTTDPVQPAPLATLLIEQEPRVKQAVRIMLGVNPILSVGQVQFHQKVHAADASLFTVFDFDFVAGDPQTALVAPYSMVISTEVARRFFGDDDPLGKIVHWDTSAQYLITGVVDVPSNTHIPLEATISLSTVETDPRWGMRLDRWEGWELRYNTYLLLDKPESATDLPAKILTRLEQSGGRDYAAGLKRAGEVLHLQSVEEIYLHSNLKQELREYGDISHILSCQPLRLFWLRSLVLTSSISPRREPSLEPGKWAYARSSGHKRVNSSGNFWANPF